MHKLLNLHTVAVDAGSADARAPAGSGSGELSKRRVLTGRLFDRLSTSFRVGDSVSCASGCAIGDRCNPSVSWGSGVGLNGIHSYVEEDTLVRSI